MRALFAALALLLLGHVAEAATPRCRYSIRLATRAEAMTVRDDVAAALGRSRGGSRETVALSLYFDAELGAWLVWGEVDGAERDAVASELRALLSRGLRGSYLYVWSSHLDVGRGGADDAATMTREIR